MTEETVSRRELNKTRTREAVTAALRRLATERPVSTITVDQLAEAAGISRRTFFNYYGGIASVLVEVFAGHAERMISTLDQELLATDPVGAMRTLLVREGADPEFLGWLGVLNCHPTTDDASATMERAVWSELGAWLDDRLRHLLPEGTHPVYRTTLASSVMHAFSAAEKDWVAGRSDPGRLTRADIDAFPGHLDLALGCLAHGWRPGSTDTP